MFSGDVMLGRTVQTRMEQNGAEWPFLQVAMTMAAADITVVNLESPFRKDYAKTGIDSLVLRGDPQGIAGMKKAGVDAVSLSNNHITDMGVQGLLETKEILAEAGMVFAGAGQSEAEAAAHMVVERAGTTFGFLSYTYGVNFDSKGVFYAVAEKERVATAVAELKKTVDVVVVLCHCGTEYAAAANEGQKAVAKAAIDAGAALYIGHHPHVPQPAEAYNKGFIIYSLGNLVFDQLPGGTRDRSALARITMKGSAVQKVELLPYQIYSLAQPRLMTDEAKKKEVWELFKLPTGQWP